jgi:hypothetical protein
MKMQGLQGCDREQKSWRKESGEWRVASDECGEKRGDTPTRVFWEKRLQVAENKRLEYEKESQEKQRGGKSLKR